MFVQRAGVVGGCVHIGLLQRVEADFVIRDQVILVQGLWEKEETKEGVKGRMRKGDSQVKEIRGQRTKGHTILFTTPLLPPKCPAQHAHLRARTIAPVTPSSASTGGFPP